MHASCKVATILLITVPGVTWSEERPQQPSTALGILAQARQESVSLSGVERDRILAKIAPVQAKAGDLQSGLTTVQEIGDMHYRQIAVVETARVLVQEGKQAAASEALDRFVGGLVRGDFAVQESTVPTFLTPGQREQSRKATIASCLRDIATAQVQFDDMLAAKGTCLKALRIIDGIKISQQRDVALRDIAFVQTTAKEAEGARQSAQKIEDKGHKNEAFVGITRRQADLGDWREALQTAKSVDDMSVIHSLIPIAAAQAKSGAMQEVAETMQLIKSKVAKPKYASQIVDAASALIAIAQFERGDDKGAFERLNSVSDSLIKSEALASIAKIQEKNGDLKGALETLHSVPRNSWNSSIIARLQAKTGNINGALQTAETITDSLPKAWAYISIAQSQTTAGDNAVVTASLEQAFKASKSVNRQNRETVMTTIATAYADTGNYAAAVKTAQAIEDPQNKPAAIFAIAKARSKTGDLSGAMAFANETSSAVEKCHALIGAAEGLLENHGNLSVK